MIVYHGSGMVIEKPEVSYSKDFLDFGKGFYLTTFEKQAEKWALRKAVRKGTSAIVNVYELNEELSDFKVLAFGTEDEKWLDFVCECRKGSDINQNYDIIKGNVANDDVFKTVDMYFKGIWTKEKALEELRYYKKNDQICIVKQQVLDKSLTFKYSYIVE